MGGKGTQKGRAVLEGGDLKVDKIDELKTPSPSVSNKDGADIAEKLRYLADQLDGTNIDNKETNIIDTPSINSSYYLPSTGSINLSKWRRITLFIYATTNKPTAIQIESSIDGGSNFRDLEGYSLDPANLTLGNLNTLVLETINLQETKLRVETGDPAPGQLNLAGIMKR